MNNIKDVTKRGILKSGWPWGEIVKVHRIDDYAIVEHKPTRAVNDSDEQWARRGGDGQLLYHPYVPHQEKWDVFYDTSHAYHSLDKALIAAIVFKHEWLERDLSAALNERLTDYIMRILGDE
jgi:hypothetical protein